MKHKKTQDSNSVSQTFITTLIEKGFLSFDQVDVVLKEQRVQKSSFEDCLVSLGFISEAALAEVLSLTSGYDKINLKQTLLDPALKDLISREIAE